MDYLKWELLCSLSHLYFPLFRLRNITFPEVMYISDSRHHASGTKQQEESPIDKIGQGDEEYSSHHEEPCVAEIYGDFVLSPRDTAAQRRIRRLKRT